MKDFKEKVLVVTGAGSGIGKAIAQEGALRGMKVVVNDIDVEAVNNTARELQAGGAQAVALGADISLIENVQKLYELTMDTYGRCDMLVNNAGVAVSGPIWEIPIQDINWITEVNLLSHALRHAHLYAPDDQAGHGRRRPQRGLGGGHHDQRQRSDVSHHQVRRCGPR